MTSQYKHVFLRKILAVTYFVANIFGLWPYNIDRSNHHIRYNRFKFIYSIIFPIIVLMCYYLYGVVTLLLTKSSNNIPSKTMDMIVEFYSVIIMVSFAMLYVGQHFKLVISNSVYVKYLAVSEILGTFSMETGDIGQCYVKFFIKTIVSDIVNYLSLQYNLTRSSRAIASYPYVTFVLYMPVMIVRFYENIFYGGLLLLNLVFKEINEKLVKIVTMTNSSEFYRKMEKYCELSEELDRLSSLHFTLSELTLSFNTVYEYQLFFWMAVQFGGLIIRGFYQYIGIVHFFNSPEHYDIILWQNFVTFVISLSNWCEILMTTSLCESLATEVTVTIVRSVLLDVQL